MNLTKEDIKSALDKFFRRAEAARAVGGISRQEIEEGATIPDGWERDLELDYWLPPNVRLL